MKKVVIADHHPLTANGIESLLKNTNEFLVVDKISRGSEIPASLQKMRPEILILEINIPDIKGFHALRSIREDFPRTRILIFSSHPEEIYAVRSIKAGASGYVPKTAKKDVFLQAIKRISAGGLYLNEKLAVSLNNNSSNDNSIVGRYKKLSAREIEVLNLLSKGKRNKDISSLLEINEKTVSTYKTRLLKKLRVNSLAELLNQARMFQF